MPIFENNYYYFFGCCIHSITQLIHPSNHPRERAINTITKKYEQILDLGGQPGLISVGSKKFLFHFWVVFSWLPFHLELVHGYAKWLIRELIHVWLSIRLNGLIARHKTNWAKNTNTSINLETGSNQFCFRNVHRSS